jgi:hypothetical protein
MLSLLEVEGSREAARTFRNPNHRLRCDSLLFLLDRAALDNLLAQAKSAAAGVN